MEQTGKLARLDHQVQVVVIDHLCEIDARQLYLRRGYSSPFDYVTRGLGYSAAAAWRRINAMKLCVRIEGVRERLRDGSLTLDAAAQLQAAFERRDRERAREARSATAGAGSATRPNGAAPVVPARPPAPKPMLDVSAQKALVEEAVGKSTRQVMQMLAEVDPALVVPADKMRPLSEGRWELKVAIDTECQRGLEQLKGLLSHVDPHMTLGQLVGRLVKEGLERHDPSRSTSQSAHRQPDRRRRANFGAEAVSVADRDRRFANGGAARPGPRALFLDERVSTAGDNRLFGAEVAARHKPAGALDGEAAGSVGVRHYFGTKVPRTGPRDSRGGETGDLAAIRRTLRLHRSPHWAPLCLTASAPGRSRVPVRPGRRCGAGQPETSVRGSSPSPPPPRRAGFSR